MVAIKESLELLGLDDNDIGNEQAIDLLERVRAVLKRRLSFFVWQGFFEPLKALSLSDQILSLEAPTSFHRNWVMDHYMGELKAAMSEVSGDDIQVSIICNTDGANKGPAKLPKRAAKIAERVPSKELSAEIAKIEDFDASRTQLDPDSDLSALSNKPSSDLGDFKSASSFDDFKPALPVINQLRNDATILPLLSNSNLNPTYSFEAFVQGPSNQMCFAAAMSVADHPGTQFSPLFLFGGVGLGKTHLLHAIGLRAKEKNPTLKVVFLSAEQWVNSYIQAIRERQFDSFRNRYRNGCDILLIDDIQFLAGKDASQDEFFHTFNCLHEAKKQIVVTSDKYPHEISGLEERLQTRLSWGLIADIRPPEIETRIAILHKKAESLSVKLSNEVLNFLASTVTSSVRELEGALVRVAACSSLAKQEISLVQAREILAPVIKKKQVVVSWQKVCDVVAAYYDLRPSELLDKSRQRQVAFARQVAMACCRSMLSMSLPEIGRAFGGRDHSTVISSLKKIEELKKRDVSLQSTLLKIEAMIAAKASLG